jgi:hypothetical protein
MARGFTPRKPTLSKPQMTQRRRAFFAALAASADGGRKPAGNGGNGGVLPSDLSYYVLGVDYSSWVDPGGGAHRRATLASAVTNLAVGGPTLTPHFPSNYPLLHDGAWTGLATWDDIVDPNGETWFSCNPGTEDASFPNITEWECDLAPFQGGDVQSGIWVAVHPANVAAQLYRPIYGDSTNRLEISSTGTGRVLLKTANYGPSNQSDMGSLLTGVWYIFGYARGSGSLKMWLNGVEKPVAGNIAGATGQMGFDLAGYGTAPDGGYGCYHTWLEEHTADDMNTQMAALATRFGITYTWTPLP